MKQTSNEVSWRLEISRWSSFSKMPPNVLLVSALMGFAAIENDLKHTQSDAHIVDFRCKKKTMIHWKITSIVVAHELHLEQLLNRFQTHQVIVAMINYRLTLVE